MLMAARADPDIRDNGDVTALHEACIAGHDSVIKLLTSKGAKYGGLGRRGGGKELYRAVHRGMRCTDVSPGKHVVITEMHAKTPYSITHA